jgi:hypothetical protein
VASPLAPNNCTGGSFAQRRSEPSLWNTGWRKCVPRWYVSNVSIIFDAPCLFLHHLPNVSLHFVALLCIFWN